MRRLGSFATSPRRRRFSASFGRSPAANDNLGGSSATGPGGDGSYPKPASPVDELDEPRKLGLTLVLSLRLSLSYFTLRELSDQLLVLAAPDAERTLVQHIRRRVQGEGRFGIGKELEYLEDLVRHIACNHHHHLQSIADWANADDDSPDHATTTFPSTRLSFSTSSYPTPRHSSIPCTPTRTLQINLYQAPTNIRQGPGPNRGSLDSKLDDLHIAIRTQIR